MTTFAALSMISGLSLRQAACDPFLAVSFNPVHLDPLACPDPFRSRYLLADSGSDGGSGNYRETAVHPDAVWALMEKDHKAILDAGREPSERLESLLRYADRAKHLPPADERRAESAYRILYHLRTSENWTKNFPGKGALRDQWFRDHDLVSVVANLIAALPEESPWNSRLAGELARYGIPQEEHEVRFLQAVMLRLHEERPDLLAHGARMELTRLTGDPRFLENKDLWLEGLKQFGLPFILPISWVWFVPLFIYLGLGEDAPAYLPIAAGLIALLGLGIYAGFALKYVGDLKKAGRPLADSDDEAYAAIADELAVLRLRMEDDTAGVRDRLEAMRDYAKTASRLPTGHKKLEEAAAHVLKTTLQLLEGRSPGVNKLLLQEWQERYDEEDNIAYQLEELLRRASVWKFSHLEHLIGYGTRFGRPWDKMFGRLRKAYKARLETSPSPPNPSVVKMRVEDVETGPEQEAEEEMREKEKGKKQRGDS